MAAGASCWIWLSSRRWVAEAWFLVVGIASPTSTARVTALPTGSTYRHKILGDDAPANVSFKANLTLVEGPSHPKAVFEGAQARFNTCSPDDLQESFVPGHQVAILESLQHGAGLSLYSLGQSNEFFIGFA